MTARDMLAEQKMHEAKLYTVNRFMLGDGLVCGLETVNLRVENGTLMVDIKPGIGIDCCGRLIVVKGTGAVVTKEVKQIEDENESGYPEPMHLYIRYKECLKEAVPVPGVGDACEEKCCYNRILEVFDVVYSSNPPALSDPQNVNFPSESDYDKDNDGAVLKIAQDYYNANLKSSCNDCTESLIFLGAFTKKQNGDAWDLDVTSTTDYQNVAYTNNMLYDIITRHATRFDNPHEVKAEDTGALLSINDVPNDGGNIDLIAGPDSTILISPDPGNNSITIGEDHSARKDDPHDVKPEQIGALASVNNVKSDSSNINLLSPDMSISIEPGIEIINLSLSSMLQDKILYLEDQVKSMQRYLMDKSLKYKLKVFSDINEQFGSVSAEKIVERVKEELNNRIYTDPEKYMTLLEELWEREMVVSGEIKGKVTEESLNKYVFSLEELKNAIEIGNVSQAAVAQDEVCEMAEWLESALEMVVVPNVIEMDIEDARMAIEGAGLVPGKISEEFSELNPGTVIKQNPEPGTNVPKNSRVDLLLSTEIVVSVPDVVNLNITVARLEIEKAGLFVGKITEEQSSTSEPGTVIRQSPVAGAMVGTNSPVDLIVVLKASISVPNVVDMVLIDARLAIEKAGLIVGSILKESSTLKPDTVMKQSPVAGTSVAVNSRVDLVLSTEMSISVPKVVDMNVSDAIISIEKAGLMVGTISEGSVFVKEPLFSRENIIYSEPTVIKEPLVSKETVLSAETLLSRETVMSSEPLISKEPLVSREPLISRERLSITGKVIKQNPAPGTIVPINSKVNLVVTNEISTSVAVPSVLNMDISNAKLVIEKAGLVVGTISEGSLIVEESVLSAETLISKEPLVFKEPVTSTEPLISKEPVKFTEPLISKEPLVSAEPLFTTSILRVIRQNPAPGTMVLLNSKVNLVLGAGTIEKVPDVTGLKIDDAKATIEATGLTVGKETPTISKIKEIGTVSTQSPIAGVEKPEGSSVDIRVVAEAITTPNVIGEKIDDAKLSIENAGLVTGKIAPVISDSDPGTVIYQSPTDKHTVAAGSSVNLNVVAEPQILTPGDAMTTVTPERMVMTSASSVKAITEPREILIVPDVVENDIDYAKAVIEKAGLTVDNVTEVISDLKPGTVLEQFPLKDFQTPIDSKVDLLVAVKEEVIVPDMMGLSLDEAKKRLADKQLQIATWFNVPSSEPKGTILRQEPAPETYVEIGFGVSLWVSA